ncbi:MAG: cbb3-type cytochrome c oxidase subunit I [Gammaproteobacteria bacterium]
MHPRNRLFITAALLYGLLGGLLMLAWLLWPAAIPGNIPRLHAHLMLLGFMAMMVYGVGLHVLPRFSGRPLYSERLANLQFYAANLGLWLMAVGWLLLSPVFLALGGLLSWLGIGLFTVNVLLTVRHYGPKGA